MSNPLKKLSGYFIWIPNHILSDGLHRECGNQSVATVADRGTVLTATILVSHCLTSDCLLQKSVRRKVFNHIFYIHIHSFKNAHFNTEH